LKLNLKSYLFYRFEGLRINFGYVVGFRAGIEVLTDGVDVDKAVVCHLNALKVSEKPITKVDAQLRVNILWHYNYIPNSN